VSADATPIPQSTSYWERLPSWIPLVTPAVKSDACQVDYELLQVRAQRLFSCALCTAVVSVVAAPTYPVTSVALFAITVTAMLTPLLIAEPLDEWIAQKAANVKAVGEYLNIPSPSPSATRRIVTALLIITIYPITSVALFAIIVAAMLSPPLIVEPLDEWIAQKAANVKAVGQYLNMRLPSPSATSRIQHNLSAAQLLVRTSKKGEVVNKIDSDGYRLLDDQPNLNIFKLLIDHGADVRMLSKDKMTYFEKAIKDKEIRPDYLKYVLETGKVTPEHFTPDQQVHFWTKVDRFEIGQLLIKYGFNVNVTDSTGDTPLLKLAKQGLNSQAVSALLNCGADPTITVLHEGAQKNALEITKSESIRHILQNIPSR
jgi:hypothetical protein